MPKQGRRILRSLAALACAALLLLDLLAWVGGRFGGGRVIRSAVDHGGVRRQVLFLSAGGGRIEVGRENFASVSDPLFGAAGTTYGAQTYQGVEAARDN